MNHNEKTVRQETKNNAADYVIKLAVGHISGANKPTKTSRIICTAQR